MTNGPLNNCITMALMRALIMREHAMASGQSTDSHNYMDSIAIEKVVNELRRLRSK